MEKEVIVKISFIIDRFDLLRFLGGQEVTLSRKGKKSPWRPLIVIEADEQEVSFSHPPGESLQVQKVKKREE